MGGDTRSLSDAPEDILALILSKLLVGADAAAFAAVCKTWRSVDPLAIERNLSDEELCTSPCLIFPDNRFFHPMYNVWFERDAIPVLPEGTILAQKDGWLLMKQMDHPLFFFNPFTNQRIDLPLSGSVLDHYSFSTPPTSRDCAMFKFLLDWKNIRVDTIKRGEGEFSTHEFLLESTDEFPFLLTYKSAFFRGEYYCLGKEGRLAIYNPKENGHRITPPPSELWRHFHASDCGRYLFEGEGDLWAVFIARQGRKVRVFKLNRENEMLERVHDLGDRMVFLSKESCLMERAKIRGGGNKIYLPQLMGEHCLFYSLATRRYHTFDVKGPSYHSFHGSQHLVGCTWIQININPSQFRSEKLSW